ncbi:hypothetical protein D3C84_1112870 [compost metagenome]
MIGRIRTDREAVRIKEQRRGLKALFIIHFVNRLIHTIYDHRIMAECLFIILII